MPLTTARRIIAKMYKLCKWVVKKAKERDVTNNRDYRSFGGNLRHPVA